MSTEKSIFVFLWWISHFSVGRKIAVKRSAFQPLMYTFKEVIIIIAFIRLLSKDKHHIKCLQCPLAVVTQSSFPQVVLEKRRNNETRMDRSKIPI